MECKICQKKTGDVVDIFKCEHKYHKKCSETLPFIGCPECRLNKKESDKKTASTKLNFLEKLAAIQSHEDWKDIIYKNLPNEDIERYYESEKVCYPPKEQIFSWAGKSYKEIKVIILGQDPYINQGEACGYAFAVCEGKKIPPSLKNVYKAINNDTGKPVNCDSDGTLKGWIEQGVLLLNCSLTVFSGKSNSHASSWEKYTKNIIKWISENCENIVFLLWGTFAHKKAKLVNVSKHLCILESHPSPLNTKYKFIETKCFTKCNEFLLQKGRGEIEWSNNI